MKVVVILLSLSQKPATGPPPGRPHKVRRHYVRDHTRHPYTTVTRVDGSLASLLASSGLLVRRSVPRQRRGGGS